MIARLAFGTVLLTLVADPTRTVRLAHVTQLDPAPQTPGEDRMYGKGRYVQLTVGATQNVHQIAAVAVSGEDAATLRAWDGLLLLLRDDVGTYLFGSYRSPQLRRRTYSTEFDVSFSFAELTYSEQV